MLKRILFFTLLILNLALFTWEYQRAMPEWSPPNSLPPLKGPSIQLLSEVVAQREQVPTDVTVDTTNAQRCVRIGPLDRQVTVIELTAALGQAGHTTELETETIQQDSGFWVVANIKSKRRRGRARRLRTLMAELNGAGVLDVWRFKNGPLAGMLSLGL